jgi:hypothetical protein
VVQFLYVAAGRVGPSRGQSRASKESPKRRLTEIRNYCLISYVSQQNSDQGRPAGPAGASVRMAGMGNSPRAVCGPSFARHTVKVAHCHQDSTIDDGRILNAKSRRCEGARSFLFLASLQLRAFALNDPCFIREISRFGIGTVQLFLIAARRVVSCSSFMSRQSPPANPAPSLKNPAKLTSGSRSNEGE